MVKLSLILNVKKRSADSFVADCVTLPVSAEGNTWADAVVKAKNLILDHVRPWLQDPAASRMRITVLSSSEQRVEMLFTC